MSFKVREEIIQRDGYEDYVLKLDEGEIVEGAYYCIERDGKLDVDSLMTPSVVSGEILFFDFYENVIDDPSNYIEDTLVRVKVRKIE